MSVQYQIFYVNPLSILPINNFVNYCKLSLKTDMFLSNLHVTFNPRCLIHFLCSMLRAILCVIVQYSRFSFISKKIYHTLH